MNAFHLPHEVLRERLLALPPAPRDHGTVALVVCRPKVDERTTPSRGRLSIEGGLDGDRWFARKPPSFNTQITVMRADVARVIANGQPLTLFGDNLLVELELSKANLPDGTRLEVGTALCELTPKAHTGCSKFAARFGADARALEADELFAGWRLRGVHLRIVEGGDVSPGDRITVVSRP